ncbi:SusC/RagA family TonB-linked outer membrane protein [Pedobacter psychrophilus]|uniref:SusC/RagA family TonB-linked outer membrane protein n=2 Tax=Pedobacter psychrophilus TaxID=1826909 RepID=A0A179DJM5_9SPHI|nr:SusC/RagA family TonB-linked outer membrane protein [Pedobacter psychrophilus]
MADRVITGKVVDSEGETLPGVSIVLLGTKISTTTNVNGEYGLTIPSGEKANILEFSFLGFQKKQVTLTKSIVVNVTLQSESKSLNEVVVIGYGTVQRKDLTGSVGSVDVSELNKAPVKSFDDALAGRIAGVEVTSPSGQPGEAPNIVIRGGNSVTQDNSPLYVIDGFPIENYNNNSLNPADIESIEVLKDASSTAIYGSRGANGVIIVTTKKGKVGAPVVAYDGYYGIQNNTSNIKVMDGYEYVKYQFEINPTLATTAFLSNGKTIEDYRNEPSIDWQKELFRGAPMQNHNLSVRGGNNETKYSISGNILNQQGTIINSDFKRYQGRIVLDQNLGKQFKVGINTNYSNLSTNGTQVSGGGNTAFNLLVRAWTYRPLASGSQSLDDLLTDAQDLDVVSNTNYQWNPILSANNELNTRKNSQLTANTYLQYSFLKGFTLKITGGLNSSRNESARFNNSQTVTGNIKSPLGSRGVNGSLTNTSLDNYVNENTLTFKKKLKSGHNFDALLGFTAQSNTSFVYGASANFIPNESLGISGLDEGTPNLITSADSRNNLLSYLSRFNYNYKSKYLFTANFRADGSSKFSSNNRWGYFPSGAFAWHISEEKLIKNIKPLSDAKIRISYGNIGNNRVSDFAYFSALQQTIEDYYSPGGVVTGGAYPSDLGNANLKWETTTETDLGLDVGFLNQRITLTADLYIKKTRDLLLNALLPATTGYSKAFKNIGSIENKGLELTLGTINIDKDNFKWNTNFNISFNRNKILGLTNGQNELQSTTRFNTGFATASTPSFIAIVGQPVAQFYGFIHDGNYQYSDFDETSPGVYVLKAEVPNNGATRSTIKPGDIKYKDITGNGIVDNDDRTILGTPLPKFSGGFSNSVSFKNFDINVFLQYSYGGKLLNVNRLLLEGGSTGSSNQYASYENRWTPTNPNNEYFRAGGQGPSVYSDRIIEDGSFIRFKTLNMGYTLPSKFVKYAQLKSLRVYFSAQNLFTITNYSGNDPEVSVYNSALTPGVDYSAYPRAKVYTFGLNLSL